MAKHPLIKSTDVGDAEQERKAMEGRVHPFDPAERHYRRLANGAYGGNIYGNEKGAGWDRTIPKDAAAALRREYGVDGERIIRAGKFPGEINMAAIPTIETVEIPYDDMRTLAAAHDVIADLGLQLICPKCTSLFGYGSDCVVGDNVQGSDTLTLRCGCTIRRARRRN